MLPPKLAPTQVVIVPIPQPAPEINDVAEKIIKALRSKGISVLYDTDDKKRPGFKFAEHELKGIPVRIGIGKRDLEKNQVEVARRDTKEKNLQSLDRIEEYIETLLGDIQQNLFDRALRYRTEHTTKVDNFDDFQSVLDTKGGFVEAHWDGTTETELKIKELTKATIRCIPNDAVQEPGKCVFSGQPSTQRVLFARAY